jgi:uncharacterized protein (DUF58 family)
MTNKTRCLVFLICGLIFSALLVRNGRLLLLALPFLVYLMIGLLQSPVALSLSAQRTIDKVNVVAREPIRAQVVIKNLGRTLVNLYLDDSLSPSVIMLDGQVRQRLSLSAKGVTELNYTFQATRGLYKWVTIHASASDPFGLFEIKQKVPTSGEILVRPEPIRLRHIPLEPRLTLHAPGPLSASLAGAGIDFFGIREYRTGDSLRRINWRLAARHPGARFTNEYEREEIADFGLILDARQLTDTNEMEEALFECSIRATASLSEVFLKEGNRVALLIFGGSMTFLFPGYGKKQLNLIMRDVARARLEPNLSLRYLEYFTPRLFPSRSILIVLSALGTNDLETYARLRGAGYEVLLISPDPVNYVSQMLPPTQTNDWAVRAARIERRVQLKQLMKLGVKVIDWQVNTPLDSIIQKATKYLAQRGNL